MKISVRHSLIFVFFAAFLVLPARAQDFLPDLVKRIKPSAVAIETFDARGNTLSRGSGFFVGPDRIITNRHVIERSARVDVHMMDGRKFPVRGVLAVDGEGDLAAAADRHAKAARASPADRQPCAAGRRIDRRHRQSIRA